MDKLTQKQAFMVMIEFLDNYYQQTKSDDIGALLGSLQLLEDGEPADPAMLHDWLQCVQKKLPDKIVSIVSPQEVILNESNKD